MKNEMKKIYYQVVENVLPQVYLLYNSFNNKFILLNNVRYEKYKKEKERYNEYIVGKFVVRDYTKYKKIKVGSEIKLTGKFKDLNKMSYESFEYGRYLRSMGYKGLI